MVDVTDWEERVTVALREQHIRLTRPRRAIIHWIASQTTVFSAEALAVAVSTPLARAGRSTVYRMVDQLREQGWLTRVQTERGLYAYSRTILGHHHHAICTRCGATLLIRGCAALDELYSLLSEYGFVVRHHLIELTGLCRNCQQQRR